MSEGVSERNPRKLQRCLVCLVWADVLALIIRKVFNTLLLFRHKEEATVTQCSVFATYGLTDICFPFIHHYQLCSHWNVVQYRYY